MLLYFLDSIIGQKLGGGAAFCSVHLKCMQKLSSCRFPAQSPAMMQACGRKAGQALKNQQVFLPDLILINGL